MFNKGDKVRTKAEYCEYAEELTLELQIVEWNGDRGIVTPVTWEHGPLKPQNLTRGYMIEKIEGETK